MHPITVIVILGFVISAIILGLSFAFQSVPLYGLAVVVIMSTLASIAIVGIFGAK